jgi:hypothetical protein
METRSNNEIKIMYNRMRQCIITKFIMQFDGVLYLENHYGRILTCRVRILVNKQIYSGQYALFGITYSF